MLKTLSIKNLATIESISVDFEAGLNALTGETGAGKSILVGGLELALGERPSAESIRSGARLAVSEARFSGKLPRAVVKIISDELELEYEAGEDVVLRRELSRKSRNRCFINGQMVNVADLKKVGDLLADLHGQHEHQSLFRSAAHRAALDAFAGHDKLVNEYRDAWEQTSRLRRRKKELDLAAADFEKRLDYLNYQIEEIEKLEPRPGEIEELEQEERRLAHAETLAKCAGEAFAILDESPEEGGRSVLELLAHAGRLVEEIREVEENFADPMRMLDEARVNLQELSESLREYAEETRADPARLNEVISRLESIRRLVRKHGGSEEALFLAWEEMISERNRMTRDDRERGEIDEKLKEAGKRLFAAGEKLSGSRKKAAGRLRRKTLSILKNLALEKADFQARLEPLEKPCAEGLERVEFLLAANPGLPAAPLRKVASGGELSRVMLALKSVLADRDAIPTLIFDEIDAGISGDVCRRVGAVMEKLAATHQILCVTHHPAIAARATRHASVRKKIKKGQTFTELLPLAGDARLDELARMMGGEDSAAALDLARQLVK